MLIITGAGISTASGIPDFRGPEGIWATDNEAEHLFDMDFFMRSSRNRARTWSVIAPLIESSSREPSRAHRAIKALSDSGHHVATQNVDLLHEMSGVDALHVHGVVDVSRCVRCSRTRTSSSIVSEWSMTGTEPLCQWRNPKKGKMCGGFFRPSMTFFGEPVQRRVMDTLTTWAHGEIVVIGSSLSVEPVRGIVRRAALRGQKITIFNELPGDLDDIASVVRGDVNETVPEWVGSYEAH